MFIYAFVSLIREGTYPDTIGVLLTILLVIIFVVLPIFGTWKFFKISQRLTKERKEKFIHKGAFE